MDKNHKRLARILCLKILFAHNFSDNSFNDLVNNFFKKKDLDLSSKKYTNDQIKFASKLFDIAIKNKKVVDEIVEEKLVNWEISRLAITDKMILRMSIGEMLFVDDVPPKVSITEAVEIAKEFCSEDSSSFINGIMDAIYNEKFKVT
ncbi:MAG: transcription antitermination factor NusB [Candidatus Marinimicrobia bacterium]|nr:transcription antitermination factor NusB [Candidatus Neomarinimicrobiota bacterium]|tara:strand:- start:662 stop:1102 length:441 start_codon:yes stop_codon:yes gene_type:complete